MSYLRAVEPEKSFRFSVALHPCTANALSKSTNHSSFSLLPPSLDSIHEIELSLSKLDLDAILRSGLSRSKKTVFILNHECAEGKDWANISKGLEYDILIHI